MDKFPSRERAAPATLEARISAVVVAHGLRAGAPGRSSLELCLRSAMAEPCVDELIVVDHGNDASVSSALRALQADRRDVVVVSADAAKSVAAAANIGARQASGRWLLFQDPSVVLQRGAAARLAGAGDAQPIWIAGGRLTDINGRERAGTRQGALSAFSALSIAFGAPARAPANRPKPNSAATPVAAVSGALMLLPRDAFEALGGFEEEFATDAADLDLCRRVAEAGGHVLFQPAAAGVQFERAGRGRRQAQGLALFAARSARTPLERAFASIAHPALAVVLGLKEFVAGRPPLRR